eukprot:748932-Hanusia_phi.AAC.1
MLMLKLVNILGAGRADGALEPQGESALVELAGAASVVPADRSDGTSRRLRNLTCDLVHRLPCVLIPVRADAKELPSEPGCTVQHQAHLCESSRESEVAGLLTPSVKVVSTALASKQHLICRNPTWQVRKRCIDRTLTMRMSMIDFLIEQSSLFTSRDLLHIFVPVVSYTLQSKTHSHIQPSFSSPFLEIEDHVIPGLCTSANIQ